MNYIILFIIVFNLFFYFDIVFSYNLSTWLFNFLKKPNLKPKISKFFKFILNKFKSFNFISLLKKFFKYY